MHAMNYRIAGMENVRIEMIFFCLLFSSWRWPDSRMIYIVHFHSFVRMDLRCVGKTFFHGGGYESLALCMKSIFIYTWIDQVAESRGWKEKDSPYTITSSHSSSSLIPSHLFVPLFVFFLRPANGLCWLIAYTNSKVIYAERRRERKRKGAISSRVLIRCRAIARLHVPPKMFSPTYRLRIDGITAQQKAKRRLLLWKNSPFILPFP